MCDYRGAILLAGTLKPSSYQVTQADAGGEILTAADVGNLPSVRPGCRLGLGSGTRAAFGWGAAGFDDLLRFGYKPVTVTGRDDNGLRPIFKANTDKVTG